MHIEKEGCKIRSGRICLQVITCYTDDVAMYVEKERHW